MERIENLINKLKEQFDKQVDSGLLLGTVQLLQFELTKLNATNQQSLGTPKVAVVLPGANFSNQIETKYEKYAPKPAEKNTSTKEVKETLLVEEDSVSILQKNGQLDMLFDPMKEIPTLSHQPKEINDAGVLETSLNDRLKQIKPEIVERLKETPVKDLRKAVGINDRFLFINELFRGDENMYERCIKTINSFSIYPEAEYWITRELKVKLGWANDNVTVQLFDQLVKRRFS